MAKQFTITEINDIFSKEIKSCRPAMICTAGFGLSAKFEQQGGADMVCVCSSSVYTADGHSPIFSYLPYGNANDMTLKTIKRISSQIKAVPLMAGVCATDPTTDLVAYLDILKFYNVSAVMNSPCIGFFNQDILSVLETVGISYEKEIEFIKMASRKGFYSVGTAFNTAQAQMMANAGANAVICDLGMTIDISHKRREQCEEVATDKLQRMSRAIRAVSPDIAIFVHGGPLNTPEAARKILPYTGACGLFLASAVEKFPVEKPLADAVKQFKDASLNYVERNNG